MWQRIISRKGPSSNPWMCLGDFNEVLSREDRGSLWGSQGSMEEFQNWVLSMNLIEIQQHDSKYTWFRGNSKSNLDRCFVEAEWIEAFPQLRLNVGKRALSDHLPIIVRSHNVDWGPRPFRFLDVWLTDPRCKKLIKEHWAGSSPSESYKIEIMVWLTCLGRLKTKKWLFDRGIIVDPAEIQCVLCGHATEDVNHLFFDCNFARDLWATWFNQWHICWTWNKDFLENFLAWRGPSKEMIDDLFWLRLAWWKRGWDDTFSYSPHEVVRNPCCIIWEGSTQLSRTEANNSIWEPPPTGTLKWNVDASQFSNESGISLAIGGALRDHNGIILGLFSIPVSGIGINDAEYMAILKALELSSSHQMGGNFIIESDSQNAVRWVSNRNRQPWIMSSISNKIQTMLRSFVGVTIQYRSRNSNTLADGLAKLANSKRSSLIAWL